MTSLPPTPEDQPDTLLIVEPDVVLRLVIADYLRNCGYTVFEASNAEEARQVLESGKSVSIILCEIELPGDRNGFELALYLREQYPHIRMLLTSGAEKLAAQAADFCRDRPFMKPYQPQDILGRIRTLRASGSAG